MSKTFDRLVLQSIHACGENAYGVPIHDEVCRRKAEQGGLFARLGVSYGALYLALDRLQEQGLVRTWTGPGGAERGYRDKRYWAVTETGREVLGVPVPSRRGEEGT